MQEFSCQREIKIIGDTVAFFTRVEWRLTSQWAQGMMPGKKLLTSGRTGYQLFTILNLHLHKIWRETCSGLVMSPEAHHQHKGTCNHREVPCLDCRREEGWGRGQTRFYRYFWFNSLIAWVSGVRGSHPATPGSLLKAHSGQNWIANCVGLYAVQVIDLLPNQLTLFFQGWIQRSCNGEIKVKIKSRDKE